MSCLSKVLLAVIVVLVIGFVVIAELSMRSGGISNLADSIPPELVEQLESEASTRIDSMLPIATLQEALNRRVNCDTAIYASFLKDAPRINNAFEDAFVLAISSPRLALTPIVQDMQKLAQEMEELKTDACSEPVRDSLVLAYDTAIDMMLDFMRGAESEPNPFLQQVVLHAATFDMELYRLLPVGSVYNDDMVEYEKLAWAGEEYPPELRYIEDFRKLSAYDQCQQSEFLQDAAKKAWELADGRYLENSASYEDIFDEYDQCSDVSQVESPKDVSVEYRVSTSLLPDVTGKIRVLTPDGKYQVFSEQPLPFSLTVDGKTGYNVEVAITEWEPGTEIQCEILVDGNVVLTKSSEDWSSNLTCMMTLE